MHISTTEASLSLSLQFRLACLHQSMKSKTRSSFHWHVFISSTMLTTCLVILKCWEILAPFVPNYQWNKTFVPIKIIALMGADKLFDEAVIVCPNIVAHFNEVWDILLWTSLTIKLLKFWRLIIGRHFQAINPSSVWPCICQGRFRTNLVLL